jgi:pilus assembly protein CpaB
MIRRRLLVIGCLAATIGGAVSWYVYRSLEAKFGAIRTDLRVVVIAARDIQPGDKIDSRDLQLVTYPARFLPQGPLHSQGAAIGRIAMVPITRGEIVLPSKTGVDGDNRFTAQIPVGMRALQVPVNEAESASMKPGDRVDVFVTGNAPGSNDTQTRNVLSNVRLLGIESRVVTLVAAPEDVERLILAMQESRVKLVFRNPADTAQGNVPEITRSTLYGVSQPTQFRKPRLKPVSEAPAEGLPDIEIQVIHGPQPPETIKFKH